MGKGWLKPEKIVFIDTFNCRSSFSLTCFDTAFFVRIKNNIHSIAWLEKKAECAPETDENIAVCF